MIIKNILIVSYFTLIIFLYSCIQCITGGKLIIKNKYVSNKCGLVNGVYIKEIKIDSIANNIPVKYTTILSASLYRRGASPNNNPKLLYFDKDCKEMYIWDNENIVDTINGPFIFKQDSWYLFYSSDTHEEIFMFIDRLGNNHFKRISGKSEITNF